MSEELTTVEAVLIEDTPSTVDEVMPVVEHARQPVTDEDIATAEAVVADDLVEPALAAPLVDDDSFKLASAEEEKEMEPELSLVEDKVDSVHAESSVGQVDLVKVGKEAKSVHENETNILLELENEANALALDLMDLNPEISFSIIANSIARPSMEAAEFSAFYNENFSHEATIEAQDDPLSIILETSETDFSLEPSADDSLLAMSIFMTPGYSKSKVRRSYDTILDHSADFVLNNVEENGNDCLVDVVPDSRNQVQVAKEADAEENVEEPESFVSGNIEVVETKEVTVLKSVVKEVVAGERFEAVNVECAKFQEIKPVQDVNKNNTNIDDFVVGWEAVGFTKREAIKRLESLNPPAEPPNYNSSKNSPKKAIESLNAGVPPPKADDLIADVEKPDSSEKREDGEAVQKLASSTSKADALIDLPPRLRSPEKVENQITVESVTADGPREGVDKPGLTNDDEERESLRKVNREVNPSKSFLNIIKRFENVETTQKEEVTERASRGRTKSDVKQLEGVAENSLRDPWSKQYRRSKSLPSSPNKKKKRFAPVDTAPCLDLAVARFGVSLKRTNVVLPGLHDSAENKETDALEKAITAVKKSEEEVLEAAEDVKKKTTKKKKKSSDVGVDGEKKKKKKKSTETKELSSPSSPELSDYSSHASPPRFSPLRKPIAAPRASAPTTISPRKRKESPSLSSGQPLGNGGAVKTVSDISGANDQHVRTNGEVSSTPSPKPSAALHDDVGVLPSVKQLRRNYCEQAARTFPSSWQIQRGPPSDFVSSQSVRDLRPSYNMSREIDYNKKIHVRSVDTSKVQKQFNQDAFPLYALLDRHEMAGDNQTVKMCKLCERQVFQMEQVKAEKAVWHKNCFKCKECGKQLTVDTYASHEGVLYCKPHYKQLFQPKAHFEDDEPKSSDKADLGLEELNSVDLKSRFSVFQRKAESHERDLAKSPSQVTVKKTEAILNRVARFQSNGSQLSGSESESEPENEETGIVRSSKKNRERPQSFAAMGDVKQKFAEGTFANESAERRAEFEKEKKEELIKLRARLCAVGEDVEQGPQEQEIYRDPTVVRADDKLQEELPKDSAKKALSIFKQMELEAARPEPVQVLKPLKRFTPPPGYTGGSSDDSEEESEYESDEEEEESENEEDSGIVKATDKIEDEFLKMTSERALAKNLRNKFERWEAEMEKENRLNNSQSHLSLYEEEGIETSLETTRDLKARFEALSTEPAKPLLEKGTRIKVNRFVELQQNGNMDVCCACTQKVYAMERHEGSGRLFHKNCFKCSHCSCVLRLDSFSVNAGRLYCLVHYTQKFKVKGNYEEGFGNEVASKNWKGGKVEVTK